MNAKKFTKYYVKNLKLILDNIDSRLIEEIIISLEETILKKSKVYVIGNGGSCSTASHIANDLGVGLKRRKILNLNILSLGDNNSIITALANDIGYKNIFYTQIKGILNSNDLVIALSCSGNSPNIIKAVTYAKSVGCKIVGLTGFDGGKLNRLSDIKFHIKTPKNEYGLVEDAHMILNHIIFTYYIKKNA